MEILSRMVGRAGLVVAGCTLLAGGFLFGQTAEPQTVTMPGLTAEIIYNVSTPDPLGLDLPQDLSVDPLSGDLFIAQNGASANILRVDLGGGQVSSIGFASEGLAFAPDGTLYFGLSNFLLGAWFRESGLFRKFAIIPAVRGVAVTREGRLLVGRGSFGPAGLFTDSILEVDRGDGFFQQVFDTAEAESATGLDLSVMSAMTVDSSGGLYAGYNSGILVKKRLDGSFVSINERPIRISGLNEFGLGHFDGLVYQYDTGSGTVFAIDEQEHVSVLMFGEVLRGVGASVSGITSDGSNIYFAGDRNQLWRIRAEGGASLSSVINADRGTGTLAGTIRVLFSDLPLAEAELRFQNGQSVVTAADGSFSISLEAGLYEVAVSKADFSTSILNVQITAGETTTLDFPLNPGLPERLAPGLAAEVVARYPADPTLGSSDVSFDREGNFYSMNFGNGTISKHILDPETREHLRSYIFASGGNLSNSFIVAVDDDLNVYASTGNDGVLMLPPRGDEVPYELTADSNDASIVRDQDGVNRVISRVRDVDGIAVRPDGSLVFSSGSGGSPIPGIPDGTFNSLVDFRNGVESIFSRGVPSGATESVFSNNDILKVDAQGRLMVGTDSGNVARIDPDGRVELIWPGDGAGKPDGAGAFSGLNNDGNGNLFLRGLTGDGSDNTLRMITPDGNDLITVASGMRQCFGGFGFDRGGRDVYVSEGRLVIRIFTRDGRTIAENLLNPPEQPTAVEQNYRKVLPRGDFLPHPEMD
ncbi:carboxypeptidase regulatory-like domain-containing protein [Acanthopleuribacter pedis]|uniref:Carboxypeptidase regulatory-like domain-containing protein n=1 Tax=Acanthopleuribacter pedis TaxID=442870 RepID=A0A8J7QGV9_9BACT|nr:carboxypeptidase regulatory-like domain-containing protein [Acanthopleuribacter pedis]MBO1322125.1 carboxypeptidase regulatory-like domain-containing protein [Acanthopleuribacter pedis]